MDRDDEGLLMAWARLDPLGAAPQVVERLRALPGVVAFERRVLAPAEEALLGVLADRLEARGGLGSPAAHEPSVPGPHVQAPDASPADLLAELLRRSLVETRADARDGLARAALAQLLPDEARILAAVRDGRPFALLHVSTAGRPGAPRHRVLANASDVGREAGVVLADRVPEYVTRMLALGLLVTAPERADLARSYDRLLSDPRVAQAHEEAATGGRRVRITRASVQASPLGLELGALVPAAVGSGADEAVPAAGDPGPARAGRERQAPGRAGGLRPSTA